ncbi:MAG: BMP family ABC transporter substrate-binding protein [Gammaproteobacteria bacterium]
MLSLILRSAIAATVFMVGTANAEVTLKDDPKVAFIYFSQKNDGGWSEAHERGRQKTSKALGVDIAYVEDVEETAEAVRQVVDLYMDRGYNIIVGTSYGFGNGLLEAAKANPQIAFVNAAGDTSADNLETFYARTYEAWYLAGMAAGAVSKSNKIGIVAGFPVSIVNWDINAYALGARSINPDIEVIATFANTWYDPVKEKQTAEAMIEQGVDVVACNMSSTAVVVAAEAAGVHSVGFQNDMSAAGPKGHLTSVVFHWDKYYTPLIRRITDGSWKSLGLPLAGMEIGLADVTPLSDAVPADVRTKIGKTRQSMIDGSFNPYTGPIKKQDGDVALTAGQTIDDGGLWGMDYFVEGIIGTMPKSE